jgi:hypothetical protein
MTQAAELHIPSAQIRAVKSINTEFLSLQLYVEQHSESSNQ